MSDKDRANHHHHHNGQEAEHGAEEMPMHEKLEKMVAHWLKHNADHAETYRRWAQRARETGIEDVAQILESVAEESQAINKDLEKAGKMLAQKG